VGATWLHWHPAGSRHRDSRLHLVGIVRRCREDSSLTTGGSGPDRVDRRRVVRGDALASIAGTRSRELGEEIEQLKAGRELIARDNANLSEQFKASQEQLTRDVARLSEQIKSSQEQAARDNANEAEQIKGIRDQLARVVSQASEQNAPPKIVATAPRLPAPSPRPAAPAAPKPVPTVVSAPAASQPKGEKPKLSSASRPSPPVR
jgi:hypothetical protein